MTAALGRMWSMWRGRTEAKANCRVKVAAGKYKNGNDKHIYKWRCAACKHLFDKVHVDHISPVVDPLVGFVDIDTWVIRKFVGSDCLQVLCIPCHKKKTADESVIRMRMRKLKYESTNNVNRPG